MTMVSQESNTIGTIGYFCSLLCLALSLPGIFLTIWFPQSWFLLLVLSAMLICIVGLCQRRRSRKRATMGIGISILTILITLYL